MSDNLDDDDLELDSESFDEFNGKGGQTLGDLWRDNALVKVGVVGAAAVLIFVVIIALGGKKQDPQNSYVPSGSDVSAPPGTEEANPAYVAAVEEENEARIDQAIRQGGSGVADAD